MTAQNLTTPDHVVIQCPKCGASESAEPAVLTDAPMIVCRECGDTWPAAPRRRIRRIDLVGQTRERLASNVVEAEHRPLVTYTGGEKTAWSAKLEGDYYPPPPQQRRLPLYAGATAALMFLAAFFGARDAAVTAMPDLAGLYATVGLPVNLEGVAIEDVAADRTSTAEGDRIVVRGLVRNLGGEAVDMRPLAAILYDSGRVPARAERFDPPAETIAAGEAVPFLLTFDGAPQRAAQVAIRFQRPGESLPGGVVTAPRTTQ